MQFCLWNALKGLHIENDKTFNIRHEFAEIMVFVWVAAEWNDLLGRNLLLLLLFLFLKSTFSYWNQENNKSREASKVVVKTFPKPQSEKNA